MNKKELEQKLLEVNAQLKTLGDINALVQQSQNLPSLIGDAQTKKTSLEAFLNDLPARVEEVSLLTTSVKSLNEQVSTRDTEVSQLSEQNKELQKKVKDLIEETKVQLGVAANAKLASTFEKVTGELANEKKKLFRWLVGTVTILLVVTGFVVWWQIREAGTLYQLSFLIKLPLTSPIVYFIVFINREYNRTRNLIEEYTFKSAIARSFEAYREIIQSADLEKSNKTLDFILGSINDLYSSPMVNIRHNHHKEKENSPDVFSRARAVIDETIDTTNPPQT